MDMKKMIQRMTDIETEEKQKLTESAVTECGDEGMPAVAGQPMSVNITATGKENVEELLAMMQAAGLGNAGEFTQDQMPMRQDMDRLRAIVSDPHEMEADAAYADEIMDDEGYDNSPDEEYMDQPPGGGINKKKGAYPDAEDGDNAMAAKIKEALLAALAEKKAKPDFLDMDKDGDKKEPMKKAIKDKKKKPFGEASKPDYIDADGDGDKKEPMKKAFKDKEKKDKKVDEVFYGTDDEWKASVKKTADNVRAQLKKKHEKEKAAKSKEK